MKSVIRINGTILKEIKRIGRKNFYILENGSNIQKQDIFLVETQCPICLNFRKIKRLHSYNFNRLTSCSRCLGLFKNPFKGRHHSEEFKNRLSSERKGKYLRKDRRSNYRCWVDRYGEEKANELLRIASEKLSRLTSGEKNPFYGKNHPKELMDRIVAKAQETRSKWDDEKRRNNAEKISLSQKILQQKDPIKYSQLKRKGGLASAKCHQKYKINKVEKIVKEELKKRSINMKYSVILGHKQFDFGSKKYRILLEVQGDYWHGNPNFFTKKGSNAKKALNHIQIKNMEKDKEKIKFAKSHNMKLYHIWEEDIKNGNFSVLDEIKNEIRTRSN